jgi:hypothetical protein
MLDFFDAEVDATVYSAGLAIAYGELVGALFWREDFCDGFLPLIVGYTYAWAIVVFWQPMLTAELSSAVGTVKRH